MDSADLAVLGLIGNYGWSSFRPKAVSQKSNIAFQKCLKNSTFHAICYVLFLSPRTNAGEEALNSATAVANRETSSLR